MRRALRKHNSIYYVVNGAMADGAPRGIRGDLSNVSGDLSGVRGNIDACDLSEEDWECRVDINDLIGLGAINETH